MYTDLRVVDFEGSSTQVVIFPNPADGNVTLSINTFHSSRADISIEDMNGMIVYLMNTGLVKGMNEITLATSLSGGIYFLSVIQDGAIQRKKLIVK
jgi:hypothetical protein